MKAFYINLDRATDRREDLEASFSNCANLNWQLSRFRAIDATDCAAVPGTVKPAEKACFLSHAAVIASQAGTSDNFLVLEDDARFGPNTFPALERLLTITKGDEWDILFTDVIIAKPTAMAEVVTLRNKLKSLGNLITLDLMKVPFGGTTSYLVNCRSVHKLAAFLKPTSFDLPYDIFLRALIEQGKIKAHVTFPFLTTVASGTSSLQDASIERTRLILDTFRRMVWIHGDAFDPSSDLEIIKKDINNRLLDYGLLWAALIDPTFKEI